MDNNSPAYDLNQIFKIANNFITKVEKGQGMNLTPEQKKQYHEKMKDGKVDQMIGDLKNKMNDLRTKIKDVNNATDKAKS